MQSFLVADDMEGNECMNSTGPRTLRRKAGEEEVRLIGLWEELILIM